MAKLIAWKDSPRRKPLIINGARQVGKTWLLKEFGRQHFAETAYFNCDNNPTLAAIFDVDFDVRRILFSLGALAGKPIDSETTLLIFDEVQQIPAVLTFLKYFSEDAPDYAVTAAGSLLGLTVHEGTGYPVGKVQELNLYPLSFQEFLPPSLAPVLDSPDVAMIQPFEKTLAEQLRRYLFVGGMPEVVAAYRGGADFAEIRRLQEGILLGYERDFSKHVDSASMSEKIVATWNSIPAHLAQENKRFIFGHIRESARARDFRFAITWLRSAGVGLEVKRVSRPGIPLAAYASDEIFKFFALDVGLLGAMAHIEPSLYLSDERLFGEFHGALMEQFVIQELVSSLDGPVYYWSAENSSGEIDALVEHAGSVYAVEVKGGTTLRSRSLKSFVTKYPSVRGRRFSHLSLRNQEWVVNVPIYLAGVPHIWA